MEILKRAKGESDGEIVAWNENPKTVQDEVNRRTHKAGYTDRDGQRKDPPKIRSMPANDKYRKSYDKIKW